MKVLIVARKKENGFAPFVTEQVDALKKTGVECRYFPMEQRGLIGYLRRLPAFKKSIHSFNPDIIHAHYGLCGVFANLQRHVPVVTTYHGSDINNRAVRCLSKFAIRLSAFTFLSPKRALKSSILKIVLPFFLAELTWKVFPLWERTRPVNNLD